MRIVIEINDEGVGTYQQGDQEPQPCVMLNMGQSIRTTPIYAIGSPHPVEFLRDSNMQVDLSLSVMLPRPEPPPRPLEMAVWDPADDWHDCDYYDCEYCYEEE